MVVRSFYKRAKSRAKAIGLFWLMVAGVLIASAIALYQADALKRSDPDPGNLELFAGTFNALLSVPFLLCGLALVTGQRKSMRWIVIPSYLLCVAAYSLWVTKGWYAA